MNTCDRIVCVVGPTASGKTRLAVELAKRLDGEVVSCDANRLSLPCSNHCQGSIHNQE
mgnify:CR=1 FL=1